MAHKFLRLAFPMKPKPLSWGGLVLSLLACASWANQSEPTAVADAQAPPGLKPYTAEYTTTARGMSLSLTRELKRDKNDNYTLTNGGKMLVVGFHEVSVFRLQADQISPKSYVYQSNVRYIKNKEHTGDDVRSISVLLVTCSINQSRLPCLGLTSTSVRCSMSMT